MTLKLAWKVFGKNFCNKCYKNPAGGLVTDARSQTERWIDRWIWSLH